MALDRVDPEEKLALAKAEFDALLEKATGTRPLTSEEIERVNALRELLLKDRSRRDGNGSYGIPSEKP